MFVGGFFCGGFFLIIIFQMKNQAALAQSLAVQYLDICSGLECVFGVFAENEE